MRGIIAVFLAVLLLAPPVGNAQPPAPASAAGLQAWRQALRATPGPVLNQRRLPVRRAGIRRVKNGLGFDWHLFARGNLHWNLYQRHRLDRHGVRIPLRQQMNASRPPHTWSLGASLAVLRQAHGGTLSTLNPQLQLNLQPRICTDCRQLRARLEYAHWPTGKHRTASPVRVAQLRLLVRF